MTYEHKGILRCDECPESIDTNMEDFKPTLIAAKKAGWRAFMGPDKQYAHACPACVAAYAANKR